MLPPNRQWGLFSSIQVRVMLTRKRFTSLYDDSTLGGPGSSGLELLNELSAYLLTQTGGHYDIVSWDPRGVGLSTYAQEHLPFYPQLKF